VPTPTAFPRAFAAILLVLAGTRSLGAQELVAPAAAMTSQPGIRSGERATPNVEPDAPPAFTRKDPATGVLFGFLVPGGGQFYAGRHVKGAALVGITLGALVLPSGSCSDGSLSEECVSTGLIAASLIVGAWTYGMITAPGDARAFNERQEGRLAIAPVLDRRRGRTGAGLALRF
jgi:hypothetical protein